MSAVLFTALIANLFHGFLGLLWVSGLKRVSGPISSESQANMLGVVLILPALVVVARILGLPAPPLDFVILRVEEWSQGIATARPIFLTLFLIMLAGTALIFIIQELIPLWRWKQGQAVYEQTRDLRLDASLARVRTLYGPSRFPTFRGHPLKILRAETDSPMAALQGIVDPVLLISSGLLSRLSDDELDAVIAHEVAHLRYGGNFGMLIIWIFRALQAPNPAALILFRSLVEMREMACDAVAAVVTGKPEALASAIVKVAEDNPENVTLADPPREDEAAVDGSTLHRAREEIRRQAEAITTRMRVEALTGAEPPRPASRLLTWAGAAVLATLMWVIR